MTKMKNNRNNTRKNQLVVPENSHVPIGNDTLAPLKNRLPQILMV